MKRFFVSVLVLAAMLAVTTGTAFAGSALELIEVRNGEGGVTFIFRVTGEFSQDELNSGFVQVEGGDDFPLYCAQRDATTVVCHTTKKTGGSNVVVGFGGARFWTDVPEPATYCYTVYDYNVDDPGFTYWQSGGVYCQNHPAEYQDSIYFYNPNYNYSYPYWFYPDGVDPADWYNWSNPGEGYYYYFGIPPL
jgi:hypothetical protein